MDLNYKEKIPENFDDNSKVWIYQSNRMFTNTEENSIKVMLDNFVQSWNSHGEKVKGFASLFFGQFIVFIADETAAGVSGCSTDSSVRIIKEIEKTFAVALFNRQELAFVIDDKLALIDLPSINKAVQQNHINAETLYFNNTVLTKKELENNWVIPIKKSWLLNRLHVSFT